MKMNTQKVTLIAVMRKYKIMLGEDREGPNKLEITKGKGRERIVMHSNRGTDNKNKDPEIVNYINFNIKL